MFAQQGKRFAGLPGSVAKLDGEWVVGEALQEDGEITGGFLGVVKRKRELQKDGAEFARFLKNVEAGADGFLVIFCGRGLVGELLPEFRGKEESRVGGDALQPTCGVLGAQRLVERSIDLDGVEEFGEIRGLVEILGPRRGVNVARPVGIGPPGRTDQDATGGGGFCCVRRIRKFHEETVAIASNRCASCAQLD